MPTSDKSAYLTATKVAAGYGSLRVVHDASVRVGAGEMVGIIGPNGAGKSTFLKALFGLVRIFDGTVNVGGRAVHQMREDEIARLGVGYVPQTGLVFRNLTTRENLELGAQQVNRKERAERIAAVLDIFQPLTPCLRRRAGSLSGGEQTMLGVARALVPSPSVLLLDEISSGLAPRVVEGLWERLHELRRLGIATLMVEQRTREVLELTDRSYVFVDGRSVLDGKSSWLLHDVDLGALFLQTVDAQHAQTA